MRKENNVFAYESKITVHVSHKRNCIVHSSIQSTHHFTMRRHGLNFCCTGLYSEGFSDFINYSTMSRFSSEDADSINVICNVPSLSYCKTVPKAEKTGQGKGIMLLLKQN